METLKEKFINDLQDGGLVTISFKMFDSYSTKEGEIIKAQYIKVKKCLYKLYGSQDTPDYIATNDIEDDLTVFNINYKKSFIISINEPCKYNVVYDNDFIRKLTKRDIEDLLGYEIEIVEE